MYIAKTTLNKGKPQTETGKLFTMYIQVKVEQLLFKQPFNESKKIDIPNLK